MVENGGSVRRKRDRLGEAGITGTTEPSPSSKKRRLNDVVAPASSAKSAPRPSQPTGGLRSFASAITNALGGLGRQETTTNGVTQSQLHEDLRDSAERVGNSQSSSVAATMPAKMWNRGARSWNAAETVRPSILSRSAESLYDFPVSDAENDGSLDQTPPRMKHSASEPIAKKTRKRGRPKKKVEEIQEPNDVVEADVVMDDALAVNGNDVPSGEEEPPSKKRRPGRPPKKSWGRTPRETVPPDDGAADGGRRSLRGKSHLEEPAPASPPVLKGILTPSKGRNQGEKRRKTVAFGDDAREETEVFFEDLTTKKKTKVAAEPARGLSTPRQKVKELEFRLEEDNENEGSEDEGSNEEDDEVCEICLKPDSKEGNEIIFCDTCDLGYHQKCHGVTSIPEGDWICKSCLQEDISKTPKKTTVVVAAPLAADAPDIPNLGLHLRSLQRVLLDRCTGQKPLRLRGQEDAYAKVRQVVEQTIVAGEGNSMLVIGGRGCGKTTLIEQVVGEMKGAYKEDFHVVRLDGFLHTDDKLALKEIWRQLGKEMEVEDDLVHRVGPDIAFVVTLC
jgi:origin recognition complex subunit 4